MGGVHGYVETENRLCHGIGLMIPGIGIERGDAGQRSSLIREDTSTFLRDVLHLLTWMDIFRILFCFRRSGWTKDSARLRTR